ncbi:MAG: chromosomal replication initiator protein DnaA, partial [Bacteroidales bacterium]|nr:chromosomal replication initiator protein DnaA [Bacteroidales bacterium]
LETHYLNLLKKVIKKELGVSGKLKYSVVMENKVGADKLKNMTLPSQNISASFNNEIKKPIDVYNLSNKEIPNPFVLPGVIKTKILSNLKPELNFDNYIEGNCNRLARAAGWAIAQDPGKTLFNPLFLYSNVGLGKTHLAHAIGLQIKENFPDKLVIYVNSDLFYQQFMESVKNNNINDFVFFYQNVDVLILDDIQFLAGGKPKTQEVLFNIFNYFHQKERQIILTSDKSPVEISGFDTRLISRFKWGLTADLQVPDYETRIAILKKKIENNGIEFSPEVIDYLALRVSSNVRELEGAMIAILAHASLNKREITIELTKEMVEKYVKSTAKEISVEYIQKIVCNYFHIPSGSINAQTRKREISQARQISMYFAKKYTKLSLSAIGELCGNKHHATVLHACHTISDLCETDKEMKQCIQDIEKQLNG